jgi:hypothetical protein
MHDINKKCMQGRDCLEDIGLGGRITLKVIKCLRMWSEYDWHTVVTSCRLLGTR